MPRPARYIENIENHQDSIKKLWCFTRFRAEETCHELLSQALDGCNASYGLLLLLPLGCSFCYLFICFLLFLFAAVLKAVVEDEGI